MTEFHQWISTLINLVGFAIGVITFIVKTNQEREKVLAKIEEDVRAAKELADKRLAEAKADGDEKRAAQYRRLDEVKRCFEDKIESNRRYYDEKFEAHKVNADKHFEQIKRDIDDAFVPVKICKILHDTSSREMAEVKDQLKDVFSELKKISTLLAERIK